MYIDMITDDLNSSEDERDLAEKLRDTLINLSKSKSSYLKSLKAVYTERRVSEKKYKEALKEFFDVEPPEFSALPDFILIFEDHRKVVDDFFILAIELKFFRRQQEKVRKKRFREAFREIGQPLRYLIFGYDATILWHIFQKEFNDREIEAYSRLVNEVVEKLKLPMCYFSTKITENNKFRVYSPSYSVHDCELESLIYWIKRCAENHNPLKEDEEFIKRRRALKVALRIP